MGNITSIRAPINVEDIMRNIQDKLLSIIVVGKVTKDISTPR